MVGYLNLNLSVKKVVLKNFLSFTVKLLWWSLFLLKLQAFKNGFYPLTTFGKKAPSRMFGSVVNTFLKEVNIQISLRRINIIKDKSSKTMKIFKSMGSKHQSQEKVSSFFSQIALPTIKIIISYQRIIPVLTFNGHFSG